MPHMFIYGGNNNRSEWSDPTVVAYHSSQDHTGSYGVFTVDSWFSGCHFQAICLTVPTAGY